jgi:hypothetical protein
MSTYHTLLEGEDRELAARVAWTEDGRLIVQEPHEHTAEYLKLLRWDRDRPEAATAIHQSEALSHEGDSDYESGSVGGGTSDED